jgi:cytochrome c-type biogenesis protein CcmH/NrfG
LIGPTKVRPIFFVTSLLVIVVATALVGEGVTLLRFVNLEAAAIDLLKREPSAETAARHEHTWCARATRDLFQPLRSAIGVTGRMLSLENALAASCGDPAAIEAGLENMLATTPTAGRGWLALARMRWRRGASIAQVVDAIQMSNLTAPREAEIMILRARFLVAIWEMLPEAEQKRALDQLAEVGPALDPGQIAEFKAIFAAKPAETRDVIKGRLECRAAIGSVWLRAMGL